MNRIERDALTLVPVTICSEAMMRLAVLAVMLVALGACSNERELRIESNTEWSGSYGAGSTRSIDGSGNRTISDVGENTCWTFQKQTEEGSLRVYGYEKEAIFGSTKEHGDETTTAAYGVVSGCN